jgi:hypothetical protein
MGRFRRRVRRPASVLLLAALLLVPVALSGHTHVGQATHPCSICAVTHHAPIIGSAAPPDLGHVLLGVLATPDGTFAPVRTDLAPHAGRAPPVLLHTVVA